MDRRNEKKTLPLIHKVGVHSRQHSKENSQQLANQLHSNSIKREIYSQYKDDVEEIVQPETQPTVIEDSFDLEKYFDDSQKSPLTEAANEAAKLQQLQQPQQQSKKQLQCASNSSTSQYQPQPQQPQTNPQIIKLIPRQYSQQLIQQQPPTKKAKFQTGQSVSIKFPNNKQFQPSKFQVASSFNFSKFY